MRRPYVLSFMLTVMMGLAMSVPSRPSSLRRSRPPATTCTVRLAQMWEPDVEPWRGARTVWWVGSSRGWSPSHGAKTAAELPRSPRTPHKGRVVLVSHSSPC